MTSLIVPASIKNHEQITAGDVSFVLYTEGTSLGKSHVTFEQIAISFVLNGIKEIYLSAEHTVVEPGFGIVIPAGNSIMTEHSNNLEPYSSLIVFFPIQSAIDFLHKKTIGNAHKTVAKPNYILFKRNAYLNEYIKTIQELIRQQHTLSCTIAQHKLEELLLVLYELYPAEITALFTINEQQLSLKRIVENNLLNNLSLAEFAFLANRSLSSFKRDFEKTYGIAPQTYIREKKLEAANHELGNGKKAAELYLPYGYENLSNFNTAFKKQFGVTPSQVGKTKS